jgi:hypothetical protein
MLGIDVELQWEQDYQGFTLLCRAVGYVTMPAL